MTREQELKLIEIGLETVLTGLINKRRAKKKGKKWTKERHAKFAKSMAKTWARKRRVKNESI